MKGYADRDLINKRRFRVRDCANPGDRTEARHGKRRSKASHQEDGHR